MSVTRRLILQKARHHPTQKGKALTACRHMVSGTLSLPSRGTFHHSLTVLFRYRSSGQYSGLPGGPGRFTADSTGPLLLGKTSQGRCRIFTYRALTVYGGPSQATSANHNTFSLPSGRIDPDTTLPQPRTHNPYPVSHAHGLAILRVRSPLLTESQLFSSPTGTEMFHFPAFPPDGYTFTAR